MADRLKSGLEGQSGNGGGGDESGRIEAGEDGSASPSRVSWWDEDPADILDAKCERLEVGEGESAEAIQRTKQHDRTTDIPDTASVRSDSRGSECKGQQRESTPIEHSQWVIESRLGRVANGVANRVEWP